MRLEYFELIDRIVDLNLADRKISAEALIPATSTIFEGHFPGFPLMPGVLLLETMAQTSGWLVLAANRFERMAFLVAIKDVKFRIFAKPGQALSVTATLKHEGSGYAVTTASITLEGKVICEAELTLRLLDFPNDEMKLHMREAAARVGVPTEVSTDG
jgi:3-hydroxyacyl-[acyl-carrier-protein] dehydratase